MSLSHRVLRAVQTVENEFTEKPESDLTSDLKVLLAFLIGNVDMIAGFFAADLDVFPQFNRAFGAEQERPSIAPGAESLRGEPVDPNVI